MIISNLSYLEEISEKTKVVGGETVEKTVTYTDKSNSGSVYGQATILFSDSPEVAASLLKDILEI
jgi:hypothetical protein